MKAAVAALLMLGCGSPPPVVMAVDTEFALTDAQKAKCPNLPSMIASLKAKLIVEGLETTPCDLTVSLQGTDAIKAGGDCTGIPFGKDLRFTLMWYTTSVHGKEIELAEVIANAPLAGVTDKTLEINFDPSLPNQSSLVPRTRAGSSETPARKDAFNCDRTGTNVCDSNTMPPASMTDTDTCSNLEEFCAGTLYATSVDQCTH